MSKLVAGLAYQLPLAVLLVLAAGCDQGPKLPPLAPVKGVVTFDGKPLPRGMVQFVPDADRGTTGPTATGSISSDGSYSLSTAGKPGAMIGWHTVRIVSQAEPENEIDTDPPSLIPWRYTDPTRKELSVEVQAIEENVIDLELRR